MDLAFTDSAERFRDEVRQFLRDNLPAGWQGLGALEPDQVGPFTDDFRARLQRNRMLAVAWPGQYGGRGMTKLEHVVLVEELARAAAPTGWATDNFSIKMMGNTLLHLGTEKQRQHFLPRILTGSDRWCQGFSEPNAGSDLASLRTRAVLRGGEWHIDGQKTWTSVAGEANWIFLLARTNPDKPKNRGLSFLLCPLDQPGIEIRPITMLGGQREFNEVFFDDARTARENIVGEVDGGWQVAQLLLGFERGDEAATNPLHFLKEVERLRELARQRGRLSDPIVRRRLTECFLRVHVMRDLGYRILTGFLQGSPPGPEASSAKLYWSEYHQRITELAMHILGPDADVPTGRPVGRVVRTDLPGAPNDSAAWIGTFLAARAGTIYAGSSEIQRNIIAETVLGLPREPRPAV